MACQTVFIIATSTQEKKMYLPGRAIFQKPHKRSQAKKRKRTEGRGERQVEGQETTRNANRGTHRGGTVMWGTKDGKLYRRGHELE